MKEFYQVYELPPPGHFALDVGFPKTPYWYHCRETFAAQFTKETLGFFYSVRPKQQIAAFLNKFEDIIAQPLSQIFPTNKPTILWIEPAMFWRECPMRRSLLTALLRCALNYEGNNFDEAIFSSFYNENRWLRDTKPATMRFLYGFTYWTGPHKENSNFMTQKYGWHEEFRFLNGWEIKKRLISPEQKETSLIGVESLWA